jgi:hypothetical protein
MVNTPDTKTCNGTSSAADGELLPLSPYYALHYTFGMLLGVDDFDTEQAYHRAKMRLHNAWLHGEGVVWGLGVLLDTKSGETRVQAGLATDLAGRELHLDGDACLNVGEWYAVHKADVNNTSGDPNAPKFDAHIVIRFKTCLARPIPALAPTCQGAGAGDTAYSRVLETIEILMRPGKSPTEFDLQLMSWGDGSGVPSSGNSLVIVGIDNKGLLHIRIFDAGSKEITDTDETKLPAAQAGAISTLKQRLQGLLPPHVLTRAEKAQVIREATSIVDQPSPARTPPYHRLRLLFGLDAPILGDNNTPIPGDQAVLDALTNILALGPADRPAGYVSAFHRFAALDVIDLAPAKSADGSRTLLFPDRDDTYIVLADLDGVTLAKSNGGWTLTGGTVDTSVRPSHVATTAIQDLLCGVLADASGGAPGADAGGPRFDPATVSFPDDKTVTLKTTSALAPKSVTTDAFAISAFDPAAGWQVLTVTGATLDATNQAVTLKVKENLGKRLIRAIARGSGPAPLLGSNLVPLAGSLTDPPATAQNGRDFVFMGKKNT